MTKTLTAKLLHFSNVIVIQFTLEVQYSTIALKKCKSSTKKVVYCITLFAALLLFICITNKNSAYKKYKKETSGFVCV